MHVEREASRGLLVINLTASFHSRAVKVVRGEQGVLKNQAIAPSDWRLLSRATVALSEISKTYSRRWADRALERDL